MTDFLVNTDLADKPSGDCQSIGTIDITLFPGDTLDWSLSDPCISNRPLTGSRTIHSATLQGMQVTSLEVAGQIQSNFAKVRDFLSGSPPASGPLPTDCFTEDDLHFGPDKLCAKASNDDVSIGYKAWFGTSDALAGKNGRVFNVSGTIHLPIIKFTKTIDLEPAGGSSAPTRCGSGNSSVTVVGGVPQAAPARSGVIWTWVGFPNWGKATNPIVKLRGIEITSCQKVTPGARNPRTTVPVTSYLTSTTGPLTCPCTAKADPVYFKKSNTSYPCADGKSLNIAVASLNTLAPGQYIDLLYTLWFSTQVDGKPQWWAYDPEVTLEKVIVNPPTGGEVDRKTDHPKAILGRLRLEP